MSSSLQKSKNPQTNTYQAWIHLRPLFTNFKSGNINKANNINYRQLGLKADHTSSKSHGLTVCTFHADMQYVRSISSISKENGRHVDLKLQSKLFSCVSHPTKTSDLPQNRSFNVGSIGSPLLSRAAAASLRWIDHAFIAYEDPGKMKFSIPTWFTLTLWAWSGYEIASRTTKYGFLRSDEILQLALTTKPVIAILILSSKV